MLSLSVILLYFYFCCFYDIIIRLSLIESKLFFIIKNFLC